jgi:hypothetical protein
MTDLDIRVVFWAVWAVGTPLVYGAIFFRRLRTFQRHRDPRSRREALEAFGYFLVSVCAFLGISAVLYFRGQGFASLMFAISSGVFFVVGLYTVLDVEPSNGNTEARRQ